MNDSTLAIINETLTFDLISQDVYESKERLRTEWIAPPVDVLAYVERGSGEISFKETGASHSFRQGEAILSPADVERRNFFVPTNGRLVILWLHPRYQILGSFNPLRLFDFPAVYGGGAAAALKPLMTRLIHIGKRRGVASLSDLAERNALGLEILSILTRDREPKANAVETLALRGELADVVNYIDHHLGERITVADLARRRSLSASRFHRVFKRMTGMSPVAFILERRVRKAQILLSTTDLPLAEIAERTGFVNVHYFSRIFKRHVGVPPGAYRGTGLFF